MKRLFIVALMLTGMAGYSQYPQPIKLKTITMKDSYKGSSIRAYRVMRNYRSTQTSYVPMDIMPTYDRIDDTPVYYGESTGSGPCYISENGKVYMWVTSERGITYKKYL